MENYDVNKKTVIITGGANGIGKETAYMFTKHGANVVVIDNDIKAIENLSENIDVYKGDISDEDTIQKIMNEIYKKYKSIDVLINNAAIQTVSDLENLDIATWRKVIDTNLTGTFICSKTALKYMKNRSTILNVISVHYDKPRIHKYHYDASKAGVAMLTKEMALELADKGITVNAISFGAVETNMNIDWIDKEQIRKTVAEKVPLKIIFKPNEIAHFISTIIKKFSLYTTGSIFTIDGGRSLK